MLDDPNLERLEAVVDALGPLVDELCLVGGCAVGLLISDPGASPVRPTEDVDLVVETTHYVPYHKFCKKIAGRGFSQNAGSTDPICRWRLHELIIDVMPLYESVLGFSNHWYRRAFESRRIYALPRGSVIHGIDAPHFLATKLTAFEGRGEGDFVASHDLEDFVRVVDGRPEIVDELATSKENLRSFVAAGVRYLMADRFFIEAVPGYFEEGAGRAPIVTHRLERLATLA